MPASPAGWAWGIAEITLTGRQRYRVERTWIGSQHKLVLQVQIKKHMQHMQKREPTRFEYEWRDARISDVDPNLTIGKF